MFGNTHDDLMWVYVEFRNDPKPVSGVKIMLRLVLVLGGIFSFVLAFVIWSNTSVTEEPQMDLTGDKFQTFDLSKFGKGKDAKICPVTGYVMKTGNEVELALSNGKRIMVCCDECKKPIEMKLKKFEGLMY
jgi:hypothetical protein